MSDLDQAYWDGIYQETPRPGWDMDGPTPVLGELLDLPACRELGPELAVPGCGYGHDAAELARRGFRVTGVDFAPSALQGARARHGDQVRWLQQDWFALEERFDGIFDHTCFVAMAPGRRPAYLAHCASLLRPGGLWMASLFHTVTRPPGPPFALSMDEARSLAEVHFDLLHLGPAARSHPRRAGREFLLVGRKPQDG
jgi:SAM-dependent methyltransferase